MSVVVAHNSGLESDFEAIQLAVMETERGRWFLDQYASRNRYADTQVLLTSLARIEKSIAIHREPTEIDKFRLDVLEMSRAIAKTHAEIAAIKPDEFGGGRIFEASGELDSIVSATERATSEILAAAEKIQEAAWTLREANADTDICDGLDERATEIYTACSFQDLTAQRIRKVIDALGFLEKRVNTMVDIWQFAEEPGDEANRISSNSAQARDPAMSQADVDFALVESIISETPVELDMAHIIRQPEAALYHKSTIDMGDDVVAVDAKFSGGNDNIDEMLFASEPIAAVPSVVAMAPAKDITSATEHLQLVHSQDDVDDALRKIRTGADLSADEAASALDALKRMSVEDRTRLFS